MSTVEDQSDQPYHTGYGIAISYSELGRLSLASPLMGGVYFKMNSPAEHPSESCYVSHGIHQPRSHPNSGP